jgi:hypothetical protein
LFSPSHHHGVFHSPEIENVERDRPRDAADRQLDLSLERRIRGALGETAAERDLRVVGDVEEVGAAQMLIAGRLAGPDARRVDLAFEGRVEAVVPVELELPVDVLEQAAHPGDHHVPGAELGFGVTGLEHPARHQLRSPPLAFTRNATSSR